MEEVAAATSLRRRQRQPLALALALASLLVVAALVRVTSANEGQCPEDRVVLDEAGVRFHLPAGAPAPWPATEMGGDVEWPCFGDTASGVKLTRVCEEGGFWGRIQGRCTQDFTAYSRTRLAGAEQPACAADARSNNNEELWGCQLALDDDPATTFASPTGTATSRKLTLTFGALQPLLMVVVRPMDPAMEVNGVTLSNARTDVIDLEASAEGAGPITKFPRITQLATGSGAVAHVFLFHQPIGVTSFTLDLNGDTGGGRSMAFAAIEVFRWTAVGRISPIPVDTPPVVCPEEEFGDTLWLPMEPSDVPATARCPAGGAGSITRLCTPPSDDGGQPKWAEVVSSCGTPFGFTFAANQRVQNCVAEQLEGSGCSELDLSNTGITM